MNKELLKDIGIVLISTGYGEEATKTFIKWLQSKTDRQDIKNIEQMPIDLRIMIGKQAGAYLKRSEVLKILNK